VANKKSLFFSIIIELLILTNITKAQWVQTNGPNGGCILSFIAIDSTLIAGTLGGGIYRYTFNGTSWNSLNMVRSDWADNVRTFVFDGTNLFAGTDSGIYLSTDKGMSWKVINKEVVNVFALALNGINLFAGTFDGVYFTSNNGSSWTAVNEGLPPQTWVHSLAFLGKNLFAGTDNGVFLSSNNGTSWNQTSLANFTINAFAVLGSNLFAGTISQGVFRSSDNGASWASVGVDCSIMAFTVSGNNLYAGSMRNPWSGSVFLSTDNGINWTETNLKNAPIRALKASGSYLFAGGNSGFNYSTDEGSSWTQLNIGLKSTQIESLTFLDSNLFAGTGYSSIFRSSDNGTDWVKADSGLMSFTAIAFAVSNNNLFVGMNGMGSYGGVYRSTNDGISWTPTGLINTYADVFTVSGKNVFAGTNNGVFLTTDDGLNWTPIGLKNIFITSLVISGKNLFAGTDGKGVFRSTDNGVNWDSVNTGGLTKTSVLEMTAIGTNIFAVANRRLFLSTNNGSNWIDVNAGLPITISSISVCGSNLLAAGNGVFLSTNNGASWKDIGPGLPASTDILSLAIDGTHIYAGTFGTGVWRRPLSEIISSVWQGSIKVKDNGNISQSLTFGQTPSATDGIDASISESPLPPAPFGFDARFHLPTGDDSWMDYRSSSKDTIKWIMKFQPGSSGYPITFSWDKIALPKGKITLTDAITGTIVNVDMTANSSYTLTNSGISSLIIQYISASTPTSVKNINTEIPTVYSLMQNYPNPFNPTTVIKYGLPGNSNVKLMIYNVLGQLVESLVNGMQSAGFHVVTWNASNKASGIYLYSIEAVSADSKENFHSVKKLLLLK
jgi:photosystem II stability/assembly factor-like uncharacterized protein